MHLFLKEIVRFENFVKEDYPEIQKQRSLFLQGLDENSGPSHIVYSDFYLGKTLRFAMGFSQALEESETVICIDKSISYRQFPFEQTEELDALWDKILRDPKISSKRAYLIDYELHHGDGSGELYLSILEN